MIFIFEHNGLIFVHDNMVPIQYSAEVVTNIRPNTEQLPNICGISFILLTKLQETYYLRQETAVLFISANYNLDTDKPSLAF